MSLTSHGLEKGRERGGKRGEGKEKGGARAKQRPRGWLYIGWRGEKRDARAPSLPAIPVLCHSLSDCRDAKHVTCTTCAHKATLSPKDLAPRHWSPKLGGGGWEAVWGGSREGRWGSNRDS